MRPSSIPATGEDRIQNAADMFALTGNLVIAVRKCDSGTAVDAATHIPGQLFDWGKSSRCLEQIWNAAQSAAA